MTNNKRNANSNEFRQWDYCPRQWYLKKTLGKRCGNSAIRKGVEFHRNMSKGVKSLQTAQRVFKAAAVITGGVICLFLLASR